MLLFIQFVHSVLVGEPPANFVTREAKRIYCSPKFVDFFGIHSARVPIVKFRHIKTNFKCDLTCSTKMGVHNTLLLRYSSIVFVKIVFN